MKLVLLKLTKMVVHRKKTGEDVREIRIMTQGVANEQKKEAQCSTHKLKPEELIQLVPGIVATLHPSGYPRLD